MKSLVKSVTNSFLRECGSEAQKRVTNLFVKLLLLLAPELLLKVLGHVRRFNSEGGRTSQLVLNNFGRDYSSFERKVLFENIHPKDPIWRNRVESCFGFVKIYGLWCLVNFKTETSNIVIDDDIVRIKNLHIFYSLKGKKAFEDVVLKELTKANSNELAVFRFSTKSAEWKHSGSVPTRSLKNSAMNANIKEELFDDALAWNNREELYEKFNIPYRRGYLLLGSPGTGKSTLPIILGTELGFSRICYISPVGISDDEFAKALSSLASKTIIVIEDADSFPALRAGVEDGVPESEKGPKDKLTRSGALNAIGGSVISKGNIIIMTSNTNPFTKALLREGRMDKRITVGDLTPDAIHEYLEHIFTDVKVPPRSSFTKSIPVMKLQALISVHMENPETLFSRIQNYVPEEDVKLI